MNSKVKQKIDMDSVEDSKYSGLGPKKTANFYFSVTRVLDVSISFLALIVFSPIIIVTCIAIFLEDGQNPIFIDKRLGKDKRIFNFYKFRSMIVNASNLEMENKELYSRLRSGEHKMKDHPYVTKVGKFIRKYSIDEMLQFINVLKGDMSVVGPRALKIDEEKKFRAENPNLARYLDTLFEVRPGITGMWQVSGRSKIDFKKRIQMEALYARTYSLFSNILIMLKTPIAVLKAETH